MPTQPYIIGGKRVPSVTTILSKFKDPGPLMYWSWSKANDVLIEVLDQFEQLNKSGTLPKEWYLSRANFRNESNEALEAGTIAHEYIEEWVKASPQIRQTMPEGWNAKRLMFSRNISRSVALAAYQAIMGFESWAETHRFLPVRTEIPLLSRRHLYGGTIDCIGKFGSQTILFDWKTSKSVYADYLCQLAAYWMLWEENHPQDKITACHLLRFDKATGDSTDHKFTDLKDGAECFLLFRQAYDLMEKLNRRVR